MGQYLSSADSWKAEYLDNVLSDPSFGLNNGWYESSSNWHSFNDFFSRKLSSPKARPIAWPNDDSVVVSAADSEPQGVWQIDGQGYLLQHDGVTIKSKNFNSISQLLGPDTAYADAFNGGTLTHSFLNVHDYHHYHFPMNGKIVEMRTIPADDAVGEKITWDKNIGRYLLQCDEPGWQSIETRACIILETEQYGLVAFLPVGMSQVGSVNYEDYLKEGDIVKKGDPMGYFLFGGSDFVYIFQKGITFTPITNKHLLMGEEFGHLSK